MNNFEFYNPTKIIFGKNSIAKLGQEIRSIGYRKVLLICGGGSARNNGAYDQVVSSLNKNEIDWIEAWGVKSNPEINTVRKIIETAKNFKPDAILALGGGSVIDSAKAVAAGVFTEDVWQLFIDLKPIEKAMPIFSVLTISGTCSEMNSSAVVTNSDTKQKWHIKGPALFPKISFIDPEFQATLPWNQTVNGALDALSHITEYYFIDAPAETTLTVNDSLCRIIIDMVDVLNENPSDYCSRANLIWAETLAFNGISGAGLATGDFALHGIEHAISAVNPNIPHGAGMGVLFLSWAMYCMDANQVRFERWARRVWKAETAQDGVRAMRDKIRSWSGAVTLQELGVEPGNIDEIAQIAASAKREGVVKKILLPDIKKILQMAL